MKRLKHKQNKQNGGSGENYTETRRDVVNLIVLAFTLCVLRAADEANR